MNLLGNRSGKSPILTSFKGYPGENPAEKRNDFNNKNSKITKKA